MKMIKKGIIVGININNKNNFDESMEELKNLCLACKIETVGQRKLTLLFIWVVGR